VITRGEVLERMTLVRAGALELEALFQDGASSVTRTEPVVFAGPHPRFGGNMDSAVLAELVWGLARAGHPTLRFNWRGIGASQGETRVPYFPLTADAEEPRFDDEADDLASALDQQVGQLGARTCALVGYSLGALVAARVACTHPAVERVVLVSPPVALMPAELAAATGQGVSMTIVTGELDVHAPVERVRASCGGLLVHVVPGATHTYLRGLSQLGSIVVDALGGPAPSPDLGYVR
jgi:uncharacterized protein